MIKLAKIIFKQVIIISLITLFLLEIASYGLVKKGIISNGLPTWVTLHADKDFGLWHPKNITFDNIKTFCWKSKITYNNMGMRSVEDVSTAKTKKRVGLLGDSMIENIELSDGQDIGSKIKKKLPNYEILNFSARGIGLADQTIIYKKLIKKFDLDYLFLFIHHNDFINNSVNGNARYYHRRFDVIDNKIIEIPKNKVLLEQYNSSLKRFIRKYSIKLKNFNIYKLYLHTKSLSNVKKQKPKQKVIKAKNYYEEFFKKNKLIYEYISSSFMSEVNPDTKLFVIQNLQSLHFTANKNLNEEKQFLKEKIYPFYKTIWKNNNFIDPTNEAKSYIKDNNLLYPYFSWKCGDDHYNIEGSEFMSSLVANIVNKN
jgi:hypothetical protein